MDFKTKQRLRAKSLLAFGVTSRWQTIMRRGRPITNKAGVIIETAPISLQEIEDTMDHILSERKKNQEAILKQMEEESNGRSRSKEDDKRGDQSTQSESLSKQD